MEEPRVDDRQTQKNCLPWTLSLESTKAVPAAVGTITGKRKKIKLIHFYLSTKYKNHNLNQYINFEALIWTKRMKSQYCGFQSSPIPIYVYIYSRGV